MPSRDLVERLQITYWRAIERAAQDFGDHEGIGTAKITRWLAQFEEADFPLAAKVLGEIKYYSILNIRAMIHNLVGLATRHFNLTDRNRILFIPIGASYEGSAVIARALRDEIHDEAKIKSMTDLEHLATGAFDALVFLDDFSGTGKQLREWWEIVEPIVRPKNVPFAIAVLVLNHQARNRIERFANVICVNELDENCNVVSPGSTIFSNEEKDRIMEYCRRTGCRRLYLRGFGDCGLLVAFKHQCPNNSLPILWHSDDEAPWEPLFKRFGL